MGWSGMGGAVMAKQYLDDNGNPIAAPASPASTEGSAKVYLDDSGNPIQSQTSAPSQPGMLDPQGGKWNVGNFLRGAGQGISQFVQHPIDSLSQMPALASTPPPVIYGSPKTQAAASNAYQQGIAEQGQGIQEQAKFAKENPMYFAGEIAGPAILTHGITEGFTEGLPATGRGLGRLLEKYKPTSVPIGDENIPV